ncbi:MAG: cytidine deaminase [Bryobacteraceae bacterium]
MSSSLESLVQSAIAAREKARAPYSRFKVGAALETSAAGGSEPTIFTGCNVENATYGLTICAERVAVLKAVSEGATGFTRIAIAADTDTLTPPCGACRQILWEFCGNLEIILTNLHGKCETLRLAEIFPRPFDSTFLSV